MEGKLFLVDNGSTVTVRDSEGVIVSFQSFEEFREYYTGTVDLSGEYYIDYEPDKKVFFKSYKGNFEPLSNEWSGEIPEYEAVIAHAADMRAKRDDPYFRLKLPEVKEFRLNAVKQTTYKTITRHMPEWKQIRWNRYMELHEKVVAGAALDALEQAAYDMFPDAGETHEQCYGHCRTAARWILQCIVQNDLKEEEIRKARSIKTVKAIKDPDYPVWEL